MKRFFTPEILFLSLLISGLTWGIYSEKDRKEDQRRLSEMKERSLYHGYTGYWQQFGRPPEIKRLEKGE